MKRMSIWDQTLWLWSRRMYREWTSGSVCWVVYGFECMALPMCGAMIALSYQRWMYPSTICASWDCTFLWLPCVDLLDCTCLSPKASVIVSVSVLIHKVKLQITTPAVLDTDRKSNLVKERLPSNIRSSGTLKAISVQVQRVVGCYLTFNLSHMINKYSQVRTVQTNTRRGHLTMPKWSMDTSTFCPRGQSLHCTLAMPCSQIHKQHSRHCHWSIPHKLSFTISTAPDPR